MKTIFQPKRKYVTPMIERVKLDNEISLVLESDPPTGPNQGSLMAPEHFNYDPFKSNRA